MDLVTMVSSKIKGIKRVHKTIFFIWFTDIGPSMTFAMWIRVSTETEQRLCFYFSNCLLFFGCWACWQVVSILLLYEKRSSLKARTGFYQLKNEEYSITSNKLKTEIKPKSLAFISRNPISWKPYNAFFFSRLNSEADTSEADREEMWSPFSFLASGQLLSFLF